MKKVNMFQEQRVQILQNGGSLLESFYKHEVFFGPSLYFHQRALHANRSLDDFAEMSYAMLVAWGMHRMGRGGAKMGEFSLYKKSLGNIWDKVINLSAVRISVMNEEYWNTAKEIFWNMEVMYSQVKLVAHSKVLAHLLPALFAPIDREYTLKYLYRTKNIPKSIDRQWEVFKEVHCSFFYPLVDDGGVQKLLKLQKTQSCLWNTSNLKTIDNMIIGMVRNMNIHAHN